MHHFFVKPEQIGEREICITGSDVNHIRNVLRMSPGDELRVRTGEDQKDYKCRITEISASCVTAAILYVEEIGAELPSDIYLFQGLPKSDKMEWIIQKAVELGVHEVIPVETRRSVVHLEGSRAQNKVRRWQAIAESAANQSKRTLMPRVGDILTFKQALARAAELDVLLIPWELSSDIEHTRQILDHIEPGQSVGIFIGPEGGFEESEVQEAIDVGAHSVTLGRRILRTETAGMTVLSYLMLRLDTDRDRKCEEQPAHRED